MTAGSAPRAPIRLLPLRPISAMTKEAAFDYLRRVAEVDTANFAVAEAHRLAKRQSDPSDPATIRLKAARAHLQKASQAAGTSEFWDDYARLELGDFSGIESAITILEADPMYFRSGYLKAKLIGYIIRAPLTENHEARLRVIALNVVDRRNTYEFRRVCRLARKVDHPELRNGLKRRMASRDPGICRRAAWMNDFISAPPPAKKPS